MSDASTLAKPDRFGRLLETLNQSELAMTSYELADMCWLLLNAPKIEESTESDSSQPKGRDQVKTVNKVRRESINKNISDQPPELQNAANASAIREEEGGLYPPQPQGNIAGNVLNFPVDNPTDLGSSLALARALKTLLRKVPALSRPEVLDEIATVDRYAATNKAVLDPVFKPVLEPWLEIALVVDGNFSLEIWHQTIPDLILFLRNYGIFRDVRVWKLVCQQEKLLLYKGLKVDRARVSTPKELLNPNGRRIVIVLSDCVADYWHNGKIYFLLNQWQKTNPVAILQMLPEWLWLKTALGDGAKVTFFSSKPGAKNQQLRIKDILLWEDVFDNPKAVKIPVFTLESKSVERWSGLVAGRGDTKVAGFVLAPNNLDQLELEEFEEEEQELNPEAIVLSFRNNSSPLAQELAELLAAAPTIFLPVVRLIRREILPEAGQVQIAEVFLGGLLEVSSNYPQSTDPDLVLYDFVAPEVRKILQRSSTRSASINVFERVSRYIAEQKGIELRDFLAELKKPPEKIKSDLQDIIYPFAKVTREILQTLGGDYARFAREELKAAGELDEDRLGKYDFSGFPELQDTEYESSTIVLLDGIELLPQQFEVAEVEISIFQTFEFVTAKLERQQKQPGLFQRLNPFRGNESITEWVIREQTGEAQRLIESLSEAVTLEMVLIPPGEFIMGAAPGEQGSDSSEQPQHKVTLQEAFLMGRYPVTQEQWQAVAALPQINRKLEAEPSEFKGDKRPVERVSWEDAKEFCDRLSRETGREYRLPTEAEWEYACRSVESDQLSVESERLTVKEWNEKYNQPFHFGETISTELANYDGDYTYGEGVKGEYRGETTPVGEFPANEFGLCDMHGNVWEWCEDDWHKNYEGAPNDGRAWRSGSDSIKVLRGGSWNFNPPYCRSAIRNSSSRDIRIDNIGFRVACVVPRTT